MQVREDTTVTETALDEMGGKSVIKYALSTSDYSIGKILQRGTHAVVYHGTFNGSPVAIKKTSIHTFIPSLQQEKIIYELIADRCNSDSDDEYAASCIIGYYGYSQSSPENISESWMSLVLEYANAGSLADWIFDQNKLFDWSSAGYNILKDFMSAIYYLHKCDYIHRDIKPDNILLYKDEKGVLHGKLSDFGESLLKRDITSQNTSGTFAYMAPELFTDGLQTEKTDIYSAGVTIWEMAARRPFFENVTMSCIIKNLEIGVREEIPATCPRKVKHIISWFWQHDPVKRPTAKESLEELKAHIDELSPVLTKY